MNCGDTRPNVGIIDEFTAMPGLPVLESSLIQ